MMRSIWWALIGALVLPPILAAPPAHRVSGISVALVAHAGVTGQAVDAKGQVTVRLRNPPDDMIVILGHSPVTGPYQRVTAQMKRPAGWRPMRRASVHRDGSFRIRTIAPMGRSLWRVKVPGRPLVSRVLDVSNRITPVIDGWLRLHPQESGWTAGWSGSVLQPFVPERESPVIDVALQQWSSDSGWTTLASTSTDWGSVNFEDFPVDRIPRLRVVAHGTVVTLPRIHLIPRPQQPATTPIADGQTLYVEYDPELAPAVRLEFSGAPDTEVLIYTARNGAELITRDSAGHRDRFSTSFMLTRLTSDQPLQIDVYPGSVAWVRALSVTIPEPTIGDSTEIAPPQSPDPGFLRPEPMIVRVVGPPYGAFQLSTTNGCSWYPTTDTDGFVPSPYWPTYILPSSGAQLFDAANCTDPALPTTLTVAAAPSPF